jgi:hypothetical protein
MDPCRKQTRRGSFPGGGERWKLARGNECNGKRRYSDTPIRRYVPFLPSRMKLLVNRLQATLIHVRVNLRR